MDGNVVLKGTVNKRETLELAETVTKSVSGVRDVKNNLHLKANEENPSAAAAVAGEAEAEVKDAVLETRIRIALVDKMGSDGFGSVPKPPAAWSPSSSAPSFPLRAARKRSASSKASTASTSGRRQQAKSGTAGPDRGSGPRRTERLSPVRPGAPLQRRAIRHRARDRRSERIHHEILQTNGPRHAHRGERPRHRIRLRPARPASSERPQCAQLPGPAGSGPPRRRPRRPLGPRPGSPGRPLGPRRPPPRAFAAPPGRLLLRRAVALRRMGADPPIRLGLVPHRRRALLAPLPRRPLGLHRLRLDLGLLRAFRLGHLPLRPLGLGSTASAGCGCPARPGARRGSPGNPVAATSAGRRCRPRSATTSAWASASATSASASASSPTTTLFVPERNFLDHPARPTTIVSPSRNAFILRNSRNVTRYDNRDSRVMNRGIDVRRIEDVTGRPVRRLRVQRLALEEQRRRRTRRCASTAHRASSSSRSRSATKASTKACAPRRRRPGRLGQGPGQGPQGRQGGDRDQGDWDVAPRAHPPRRFDAAKQDQEERKELAGPPALPDRGKEPPRPAAAGRARESPRPRPSAPRSSSARRPKPKP